MTWKLLRVMTDFHHHLFCLDKYSPKSHWTYVIVLLSLLKLIYSKTN